MASFKARTKYQVPTGGDAVIAPVREKLCAHFIGQSPYFFIEPFVVRAVVDHHDFGRLVDGCQASLQTFRATTNRNANKKRHECVSYEQ
jgi:hypothetical protein